MIVASTFEGEDVTNAAVFVFGTDSDSKLSGRGIANTGHASTFTRSALFSTVSHRFLSVKLISCISVTAEESTATVHIASVE
jgi:hypothetical protein